jgi:hypothetical protein
LFELFDLRLNCIVSASLYENGDTTAVRTPVGRPSKGGNQYENSHARNNGEAEVL